MERCSWARAIACALALVPAGARGDGAVQYLDVLSPEIVGDLGSRAYDLTVQFNKDNKRFAGNQQIGGGTFLGGGLGIRWIFGWPRGVRMSWEGSFAAGRVVGAEGPWTAIGTALRGEFLTSFGYEGAVAKWLVLHTATVVGVDYQEMQVAGPTSRVAVVMQGEAAAGDVPGYGLSRFGMRLGQQVGAHVQVASMAALYGDATLDWDGQWRVRFGVAFGHFGEREGRKDPVGPFRPIF